MSRLSIRTLVKRPGFMRALHQRSTAEPVKRLVAAALERISHRATWLYVSTASAEHRNACKAFGCRKAGGTACVK
eukprot:4510746-Pleurochrysis_carterae.AAC.1